MEIEISWSELAITDRRWNRKRCLYAYVDPRSSMIVYIGKAYEKTIAQRMSGSHKERVFADLRVKCGLGDDEEFRVLHGQVSAQPGRRVTKPVLRDVESLLIRRIRPKGNLTCINGRIERAGMWVTCFGDWPHGRTRFRDEFER